MLEPKSVSIANCAGQTDMIYRAYINLIKNGDLSFCIQHHHIMWLYLAFLLIIAAAVANHHHAWETENEYHYLIETRTLTALEKLAGQFSGILIRGNLTIQVKSLDTLQAVVSKTQYASVNKVLPELWDEITDLEFNELSLSGKPFEITLKNGVIRDMLVDQDVPTWEVNLLKSFVSQLQIDTQGENVIASGRTEVPDESQTFGTFTVMEDSVGGKCEVRYSIKPVNENSSVPLPHLHEDSPQLGITKEKNYSRCEQRMEYHSGIVGKMNWKPGSNEGLISRSSTTHIIISGHLRHFTIQSSISTHTISVNSKTDDTYSGAVYSSMNITLFKKNQISDPMPASNNLMSTGNLVYIYNNPFSNQRKSHRPSVNRSFLIAQSFENRSSNSSGEESLSNNDNSASSKSNIEKRDYLQSRPKLNEAPENPLLPYFIGYKGQSIQKSDENYVLIAARLIYQISGEIANVHETFNRSFTNSLERFTILVRLIRTMNVEQITEVENKLIELIYDRDRFSSEEELEYQEIVWDVFCYSVAHAGTGPALITIKNWIKIEKLRDARAAEILSIIPKAALAPTSEYVAAFFELITDEQVTNQKFLKTTAPLSFAELVRYTHSNKASLYYPVFAFGRMISKRDNALLETYIPHMATQLGEAVESGDSRRIQTYIMALGNFGHPKILSVFEPYLEGTIPVSKFQRLMMVVSLSKLSERFPRVARSVAYKIYLNVMETYELRCAAVSIIMKTNPPLDMLQRMAEYTNQDQDRQVNSAVKTNIENLAKLKQPEWKDLADKARIASKLLKPDINGERYSQGIFKESSIASLNIAQTSILQAIGSDDIGIPKGAYIGIQQSYGNFNLPISSISYTISSIRNWLSSNRNLKYQKFWMKDNGPEWKSFTIDRTIQELGIKPEDVEPLEGNIIVDSILALKFYPFDNHTIEDITNLLDMYFMLLTKPPTQIFESRNMNYLYQYDITLGFPTETGLPFIYTLTIPKLTRIGSGTRARTSYKVVDLESDKFMELTATGYVVSSEKIQTRIGFVTPFEHKHYIAGIDINTQLFIPAGLSFEVPSKKGKLKLKILPREDFARYGIGHIAIHHSVVPYTARHEILDFQPIVLGNGTRVVYTKEPQGIEYSVGNLKFAARSDQIDGKPLRRTEMETFSEISKIFFKGVGAHYRTFDASLYLTEAQVNFTFGTYMKLKNESAEASIPALIDKRPLSEERGEQFLGEVRKNIVSPTGHIFDMSILHNNSNYVFTLAMADSYVDDKFQALLYWNIQSPDDENVFSEFCALGYTRSSRIPLNFDEAIEKIPNYEFKAELRFGSCAVGETIKLKGNWTRSLDVMQVLTTKSEIVDECRQEMREGNSWLPTCQRASELIQQKDLLTMSMDTNSDRFYALGNRMLYLFNTIVSNTNVSVSYLRSTDNNTIDMEIKLPHDNNNAMISLRTSQMDVSFSLTDIFEDISEIKLKKYLEKFFFSGISEGPACVVDKTHIVTFDDKVYRLKLLKCWYVIITTYPKRDPNNPEKILNNPRDLIVMVREMYDGSKQIRMILAFYDIYLWKLNDSGLIAQVNGRIINLSSYGIHRHVDRKILSIYQLDGMIVVYSMWYEIYAVYDGERIKLYVSDKYLNSVRGLCGNYDMQSNNDFVNPSNCILTEPEEFVATYVLIQSYSCLGRVYWPSKLSEQSTCIPRSYIPADVISDRESGRYPLRNHRE